MRERMEKVALEVNSNSRSDIEDEDKQGVIWRLRLKRVSFLRK